MNCKQAALQIDKYLDNRLDRNGKEELEKHLEMCKDCSRLVLENKELYYYIKMNDNNGYDISVSTENIMNHIYKIKNETENVMQQKVEGLFFRRLGFSMVLAAFIMLFSFFLPAWRINIFDNAVRAESSSKQQENIRINNAFSRLDSTLKTFVNSIEFNFNK